MEEGRRFWASQVKVKVLVTQPCPTLCNPTDCSLQGPSVHGILQARYWSGLPFPFPGDLPDAGIKPRSPALQADSFPYEPPGKPLPSRRLGFDPWVGRIPWRRKWQPTPAFLPGESHGQRSRWATVHGVTKELDTTE